MSDPLIRLCNVSFGYEPGHLLLDAIDLELHGGDHLALVGPNGSGKTTLLHLIVGLLKRRAGRIEAFGEAREGEADFAKLRTQVGLLFQDADDQLFSPTVAEDVAFGPLNLGHSRHQAEQIVSQTLGSLGLAGYEQRLTHKLSDGEKRLVSLATVLAMQPQVLLLDEPAAGLDESTTERLIEILNRLDQAMIVVSHDRAILDRVTNRACKLRNGKLESATPETGMITPEE